MELTEEEQGAMEIMVEDDTVLALGAVGLPTLLFAFIFGAGTEKMGFMNSLHWAVVTGTSVGYGDVYLMNRLSRLLLGFAMPPCVVAVGFGTGVIGAKCIKLLHGSAALVDEQGKLLQEAHEGEQPEAAGVGEHEGEQHKFKFQRKVDWRTHFKQRKDNFRKRFKKQDDKRVEQSGKDGDPDGSISDALKKARDAREQQLDELIEKGDLPEGTPVAFDRADFLQCVLVATGRVRSFVVFWSVHRLATPSPVGLSSFRIL